MTLIEFDFNDRPNQERLNLTISEFGDVDVDAVSLFLDLQWTYREMQRAYDQVLAEHDLTETRFIILMFLLRAPERQLAPSVIATKLGATRATVSKIIQKMLSNGWITKTTDPNDKRSALIQLTRTGESILTAFLPHNFQAVNTIMAALSPTEIDTLSTLLKKVQLGAKNLKTEKSLTHGN